MMSEPWTDAGKLYVRDEVRRSGILRSLVSEWLTLTSDEKDDSYITMVFRGIALPGAAEGRKYRRLERPHLERIAGELHRA